MDWRLTLLILAMFSIPMYAAWELTRCKHLRKVEQYSWGQFYLVCKKCGRVTG